MKINGCGDPQKQSQFKANQSQFKPNSNPIAERAKIDAKCVFTKDYNNKQRTINNAKQTQNKPNSKPIQTKFQTLRTHLKRVQFFHFFCERSAGVY